MFSNENAWPDSILHIVKTAKILNMIQQHLAPTLRQAGVHGYPSKVDGQTLTLMVTNSHDLTWIKYHEAIILKTINTLPQLGPITKILFKISPHLPTSVAATPTAKTCRSVSLSTQHLDAMNASVNHIQHPALKSAFTKLLSTLTGLTDKTKQHSS